MKVTNKSKRLAAVAAVVVAFNAALAGLMMVITYPTAKHVEVARLMASGPQEAEFARLMTTPEATWTVNSGLATMIVQVLLYVTAIYLTYRYIRQRRLTPNAGGITTGIFAVASIAASLTSIGLTTLYGVQSVLYENAGTLVALTVFNLISAFLMTFIAVLVVEKIYDRKHSFAIE